MRQVARHLKKSDGTAKRRIGLMLKMGLINKATVGSGYVLAESRSQTCEPNLAKPHEYGVPFERKKGALRVHSGFVNRRSRTEGSGFMRLYVGADREPEEPAAMQ